MSVRKMVVRSLVVVILVLAGGGYYAFQRWTNPQAVRELVLRHLADQFPGADVRLAAAELRLLGGVHLRDLRVAPEEGAEPLAVVPEVVLQLDRERLTHGQLLLRRAVVQRPQLHLVRDEAGVWNLEGLQLAANPSDQAAPVIEIVGGSLHFHDLSLNAPPLRLTDLQLALVPTTATQMRLEGAAALDLLGRCQVAGTLDSRSGAAHLVLTFPRIDLTPALLERLAYYYPVIKKEPVELAGQLTLTVELTHAPGSDVPLVATASGRLTQGRFLHGDLPYPATDLQAEFAWDGSRLAIKKCTGILQEGRFTATGHATLDGTAEGSVRLENAIVTPAIYGRLPRALRILCEEFQPVGRISFLGAARWEQGRLAFNYRALPQEMAVLFEDLPYPVTHLAGELDYSEAGPEPRLLVNLTGKAAGQPVRVTGRAFGLGLRPDNDLKSGFHLLAEADNIPIDEQLLDALRPYPDTLRLARQFHASGRIDCSAQLERAAGTQPGLRPPLRKLITVQLREGAFVFDQLPCRLEQVTGTLEIGPAEDTWRFFNFRGHRKGGVVTGSGRCDPTPDGERLRVELQGQDLLLDDELKEALPVEAREAWDHLQPTGRVSGRVVFEQTAGQRPPFIDLVLYPQGGTIKPACFPYLLTDVRGQVHWRAPVATFTQLTARHGDAVFTLKEGNLTLRQRGGERLELKGLYVDRLVVDKEFLAAVPSLLRSTLQTLEPDQPLRLAAWLIVDSPGAIGATRFSWDGSVGLYNSRLHCGVELTDVTGVLTLRGLHDGQRLYAKGKLNLDQAVLLGQPFQNLAADVSLTSEEILLSGFQSSLHGGAVRGEIGVSFTSAMN
ncbi:MAG TPA: hypothetical protein PKC45_13835, partial [Gemmatales bacterium]|nr:hypothetical protein [Gemmatales bacterium]